MQKIDQLKAQLSVLVDLTTPGKVGADGGSNEEDVLDDEELEVLQAASVLPTAKSKEKGRWKYSGSSSKHVVFVSNEEEGDGYSHLTILRVLFYPHVVRNYRPPRPRSGPEPSDSLGAQVNDAVLPVDLGWEWPEGKLAQKKLKRSTTEDHEDDTQQSHDLDERKQAAAVCLTSHNVSV